MKLDLKLYEDTRLFCYERAIISTMLYFKRNYQNIFLHTLDFTFCENEELLIGQQIGPGNWQLEQLLERHHGVQINSGTQHDIHSGNFEKRVESELENGRPVFVEKELLVYGLDQALKEFYVYKLIRDTNEKIPANLICDSSEGFSMFRIVGEDRSDINKSDVLNALQNRYENNPYTMTIKQFAEHFLSGFNMEEERKGVDQHDEVPIIKNVIDIARGRLLYKLLLEFVDEKYHTNYFNDVSILLDEAESKWLLIVSILVRSYFKGVFLEKDRTKIYKQLLDIADTEETLVERILSIA